MFVVSGSGKAALLTLAGLSHMCGAAWLSPGLPVLGLVCSSFHSSAIRLFLACPHGNGSDQEMAKPISCSSSFHGSACIASTKVRSAKANHVVKTRSQELDSTKICPCQIFERIHRFHRAHSHEAFS